jgi:NADH-quinone oxidoreductase subunit M
LPKAHVEAPTLGRVLLAGVLLKQGTYGTVVILNLFQHYYRGIFLYLRFLGAGLIPLAVAAATDIKAWVALSSVVHMNALVTGLLTFSRVSKTNSILIMLFHGVTSRGIFLIAGGLIHRFNTRRFYSMQGCSSMEQVVFLLFLFCNMGVPPFARFLSEFLHYAVLTSFMGGLGFLWILNFVGVFYYCLFVSQVINKLPGTLAPQRSRGSRLVLGLMCISILNLSTLS